MRGALCAADIANAHPWGEFVMSAYRRIQPSAGVLRLAENGSLLNLQKPLVPLGHLVSLAESNQVAYRILAFEPEPQWLPSGADPNCILAHSEGSFP